MSLSWYKLAFIIPVVVAIFIFVLYVTTMGGVTKDAFDKEIRVVLLIMIVCVSIISSILNFNGNKYYLAAKLYNIEKVRLKINYYQRDLDSDCFKNQYSISCARLNNYIYKLDKNTVGEDLYSQIQRTDNLAAYFSGKQD